MRFKSIICRIKTADSTLLLMKDIAGKIPSRLFNYLVSFFPINQFDVSYKINEKLRFHFFFLGLVPCLRKS